MPASRGFDLHTSAAGAELVLAVDIGGTKASSGVVSIAAGSVSHGRRVATGRDSSSSELWSRVSGLIDGALADVPGLQRIGVGVCGPFLSESGVLDPVNLPAWRGLALGDRLRDRYPGLDVTIANDAVCMALGEQRFGHCARFQNVLGVVVSTGVGAGLVLRGRPIGGTHGNTGHLGHLVVVAGGLRCACGGRGCLEAYASGPSSVLWARSLGWRAEIRGTPTASDLAADAFGGDAIATRAIERAGQMLGAALAGVVALLDVEAVVLGGGFAGCGELLLKPLREAYDEHAGLSYARGVALLPAVLGDSAGLLGAAILAEDHPS